VVEMKKRSVFLVLLILAAAAVAAYLLFSPTPVATAAPAVVGVMAKSPDPDEVKFPVGAAQLTLIHSQMLPSVAMPVGEILSARVTYDEDVTVRLSPGVAGRVVAIKAAPGDHVKAGQVLAEIDSADFGAALADLSKARADEERKRLIMERAKQLVPGEAIAGKDWEAAQADYTQARAESLRATQRVQNINPRGSPTQGQRVSLASPIDGIVAERSVTPSLEVSPGMASPLFVVTNPHRLWLLIDLPETMLSTVTPGAHVDVESDAYPDQHFAATVAQAGQVVDPNTRRVVVRAQLENKDGKLLPEMFVRCTLLQAQGSAVRVPNGALVNRGLYTYVFVQSAPGRFQRRQVMLATRGSDVSYLIKGIAGGENVVTAGALLLDAEMSTRAGTAP
jgi:cobalt-zinc-cadmium efflux system membrane fusion protein